MEETESPRGALRELLGGAAEEFAPGPHLPLPAPGGQEETFRAAPQAQKPKPGDFRVFRVFRVFSFFLRVFRV